MWIANFPGLYVPSKLRVRGRTATVALLRGRTATVALLRSRTATVALLRMILRLPRFLDLVN